MDWLILVLVLGAAGVLLVVVAAIAVARGLLRPPRMTDGRAVYVLRRLSPGDLGMPFEEMPFDVRDEHTGQTLRLAAWWIPAIAPSDRCAILLHGYADAKVGAIAWAPLWRSLGFNSLALDLRAHGQSGGTHSTGAYLERHDVSQVIDELRRQRPRQSRRMVLFGASLGGAVALATAAQRQRQAADGKSEIDALVLDCPFADYTRAATAHAVSLGAPRALVMPLALRLARWQSGADFDVVRPLDLIREVRCPLMLVQSLDDAMLDPADAQAMALAVEAQTSFPNFVWRVEGAGHLLALASHPHEYQTRLHRFLTSISEAHPASNALP
jgi:fermentation-respiration switch protein FrsA (DUF1100 family)